MGDYKSDPSPPMLNEHDRQDDAEEEEWVADPTPQRPFYVRYGLLSINILFFVAAVTLVIIGSLALRSSITQMCVKCEQMSVGATAVGAIFVFFSAVGLVALRLRAVWLLVLYVVVLFGLVIVIISFTIAAGVYAAEGVDLGPGWRDRVASKDDLICDVQRSYVCSGWSHCCGEEHRVNVTDDCRWDPAYCSSLCTDTNKLTSSCESAVEKWLKTILVPFELGMSTVLALMIAGGYMAVKLRGIVRGGGNGEKQALSIS
eukprot:Sspe_Gene.90779::Locus_62262_Transcript_1_1_Confidence_1.000_Length_1014::g.90779::m.90779